MADDLVEKLMGFKDNELKWAIIRNTSDVVILEQRGRLIKYLQGLDRLTTGLYSRLRMHSPELNCKSEENPIVYNDQYMKIDPNLLDDKAPSRDYVRCLCLLYRLDYNRLMRGKRYGGEEGERVSQMFGEACYGLRTKYGLKLSEIAKIINRDHSVVIKFIREMCEKINIDYETLPNKFPLKHNN